MIGRIDPHVHVGAGRFTREISPCIVHSVVDERGVRLYLVLTIQGEIEQMMETIARHRDLVFLLPALRRRVWRGVGIIGNLPEGKLLP